MFILKLVLEDCFNVDEMQQMTQVLIILLLPI